MPHHLPAATAIGLASPGMAQNAPPLTEAERAQEIQEIQEIQEMRARISTIERALSTAAVSPRT
jgi:hypothetical protein